jgi:hypothetical protein
MGGTRPTILHTCKTAASADLIAVSLLLLLCRQVDVGCHAAAVFQRRLQIWSGRSILVCRRYARLWVLPCLFTLMILLIGDPACDVIARNGLLSRSLVRW